MAGKQQAVSSSPSRPNQCYQCNSDLSFPNIGNTFTSDSHFYLPVGLPLSPSLPSDVALWLIELRHRSESSDLLADPRPFVDDETGWSSDEEDQNKFELNSNTEQDTETAQPNPIPDCEEICTSFYNNDDTVLNLDLHRRRTTKFVDDNENDDLYQIWEGLKIPRQSLCTSSLRVPNLNANCEVLSRESEADTRSYFESKRGHSYWEFNPMYSKGGLVDPKETRDGDKLGYRPPDKPSPFSRNKTREWDEPQRLPPLETLGEKGKVQSNITRNRDGVEQNNTHQKEYVNNPKDVTTNNVSTENLIIVDKPDHNRNWRLTDISEECVDDVGYTLSHENNYGIDNYSTDDSKDSRNEHKSSSELAKEVCMNFRSSPSISSTSYSESEFAGQNQRQVGHLNSPLGRKCVDILNNLDDMILTFQQIQEKTLLKDARNDSTSVSIKDNDFEHMCERAELIIEETLKCHLDSEKSSMKTKKPQPEGLIRAGKMERINSDMSDDVFLNPIVENESSITSVFSNDSETSRSEKPRTLNVNEIFDDESKTTPPVPPVRKKRMQDSPKVNDNAAIHAGAGKHVSGKKENVSSDLYDTGDSSLSHTVNVGKPYTEKNKPPIKPREKIFEKGVGTQPSLKPLTGEKSTLENIDKNMRSENNRGKNGLNQEKESASVNTENISKSQVNMPPGLSNVALGELKSQVKMSANLSNVALGDSKSQVNTPPGLSNVALEESKSQVKAPASLPNVALGESKSQVNTPPNLSNVALGESKSHPSNFHSSERQRKAPSQTILDDDRIKPVLTRSENICSSLKNTALEDTETRSSNFNSLERQRKGLSKTVLGDDATNAVLSPSENLGSNVKSITLGETSTRSSNFNSLERQREGLGKMSLELDRSKPVLAGPENMYSSVKNVTLEETKNRSSNFHSLERQREALGKTGHDDRTKPVLTCSENISSSLKNVVLVDTKTPPSKVTSLERQYEGSGKTGRADDRTKPVVTRSENMSSNLKNATLEDAKAQPSNSNSLERSREGPGKKGPEVDRTTPVLPRSENKWSSLKNLTLEDTKPQPSNFRSLERQREDSGKINFEDNRTKPVSTPLQNIHMNSKSIDPRIQPSNNKSLERRLQVSEVKNIREENESNLRKLVPNCDESLMSSKTIVKNEGRKISGSRSSTPIKSIASPDNVEQSSLIPSDSPDNTLLDDTSSSTDSNASFNYKIQLTQTRPISFSTFPPSNPPQGHIVTPSNSTLPKTILSSFKSENVTPQKSHADASQDMFRKTNTSIFAGRPLSLHNFQKASNSESVLSSDSNACLLKYATMGDENVPFQNSSNVSSPCVTPRSGRSQGSDTSRSRSSRKSFDTTSLDESLERTRKGSNASDIAAWKQRLQLANSYYHDEEMDPNSMMSNEWFSSTNADSSAYLLDESRKDCSPSLPDIQVIGCKSPTDKDKPDPTPTDVDPRAEKLSFANIASLIEAELRGKHQGPYRVKKAKSLVLNFSKTPLEEKDDTGSKATVKWPEVWDENIKVVKEGVLHRTKIMENGKKVRKNWVASFAVLTDQYLLFFKDVKTFNAMKISTDKFQPELTLDLSCGTIEQDEKLSSRKNVLCVGDGHGFQLLVQLSTPTLTEQWFHLINTTIALQLASDNCLRLPSSEYSPPSPPEVSCHDDMLKSPRFARTRSIKVPNRELESNEDLSTSAEERQTKNRARLKKFFGRRPTKESLVTKGIYKDEPMFGRNLCDVVSDCVPCVPRFVTLCIRAIESKEENMKTDGLYRASGNLSQVQKIRLQVDQNQLCALEEEEDVHVLTGALKLFFRELKKPLIPSEFLSKAITASAQRDHKERVKLFRNLVQSLPTPNHNTLDFLLQHLLKVNENNEFNRMHIPNIAIVFGPTLMWPEQESLNMALDLMKQNQVIECLLLEYNEIFC